MPVRPGTRLGPYEILDLLGAGGMGEVYRARDTRLDRLVALKVLPDVLAADPSSRSRLEREAKAISALTHRHICALHDIGRVDDTDYLVLELLEGETLAARLERGALPLGQVLRAGSEIADALGAAHRHGIVHRDLKPGNIMLTPAGVKLLDFGLAKPVPVQIHPAVTTAHASGLTSRGTIVGTLQYMAPEQIQGLEADARTDIFALGAVLYEMCTGRRAFDGQSQASLIAKILETDPPLVSSLAPVAPSALDQLVQRCLAKDPADRWQSAHDIGLQLRGMQPQSSGTIASAAATVRRRRAASWLPWSVAALCAASAVVLGLRPTRPPETGAPPIRFDLVLPEVNIRLLATDGPLISPDGRWLAYAAAMNGARQLFRRDLLTQETVALRGTDGAVLPFWSPDSRSLAFFAGGLLQQVSIDGGGARTLAPAPQPGGGSWREGVILFAPTRAGVIHRIPATGGAAEPLDMPATVEGRPARYIAPSLLPDGRTFLALDMSPSVLYAGSLDRPGALTKIETDVSIMGARYVAGHLVFRRGPTLGRRPFDARRLEFSGPFTPLAENTAVFSVSRTGMLAYRSLIAEPRQLTWFNRDGTRAGTVGDAGQITGLALAASGRRAAVWRDAGGNVDIWNVDLRSSIASRVTSDPTVDSDAAWSPDERTLAFSATRSGRQGVYLKRLTDGKEEFLAEHAAGLVVDTWTPDGRFVVARTVGKAVYLLPVTGDRQPRMLVDTPFIEDELQISPDGRWVAFNSDESGRWEVYVARFPDFTSKEQLSVAGGVQPKWRGDGGELFFLGSDGAMMSVRVALGAELVASVPTVLFRTNIDADNFVPQYGVTADGQRFLALDRGEHRRAHVFTFLLNVLQ